MNAFKRNLILGYSFSLILLLASSIASFISIDGLFKNNKKVDRTNVVISKLQNALSILKDAETGQRGFLLTGEEIFLEPYINSRPKIHAEIKDIRALIAGSQLQELTLIKMTDAVTLRMQYLESALANKRNGDSIGVDKLHEGKQAMDNVRELVAQMIDRERMDLARQTSDVESFARSTPLLIFIASLLAILITIVSFLRVMREFSQRQALQRELEVKDKEIRERIDLIASIAEKITDGDYTLRVDENAEGKLGTLAVSLNKMSASLNEAFTQVSENAWLNLALTNLTNKLLGEQTTQSIAQSALESVVESTESSVAAFYTLKESRLEFVHGHSFQPDETQRSIRPGDGIAGHALATRTVTSINDIRESDIYVNYAMGKLVPRELLAIPLLFNGQVNAVIVLGTLKSYLPNHREYLDEVAHYLGILLNTAENRAYLSELLMKTQAQAEELTMQAEELNQQHIELEKSNLDLSIQTEKLKVSEEELKVQQEELMQSNSELEERTRLLEERNQMIAQQNYDIELKARELEQSSRYKSEFLANMSHELRTPLNSILLLSRLMSDNVESNLTEQQIEYAKVIQGSGRSLLSLIDEILDLSKIESGRMELHYAEESVSEIVQNTRSLFDPVAADKGLAFEIQVAADVPLKLETDGPRLEQILKNLLSNAFKFTSAGTVTLSISAKGGKILFDVADTGIGIAPDKQDIIFEAFRQEDGSTRRNYGGTGLGLSISRELARLLGGELTLKSGQGVGSTFTLAVAIEPTKPVTDQIVQIAERASTIVIDSPLRSQILKEYPVATIPDDRNNITAKDKVILIIEDDASFAKNLLEHTRRSGYKAILTLRGDEAIELANQFLPVGILLDINLPVMNGWEVLEALKSAKRTRHIPVHVMSSEEAKYRSLLAGAVDFTNKPLAADGMQEVFKKIEQVLSEASKKVLIVEENTMHAKALAYFLEANSLNSEITSDIDAATVALREPSIDCVILDMTIEKEKGYDVLEKVRTAEGLANIPIIVFTGKNLSPAEEVSIKKYADSIVIKTAHSYKRLLDEVSLFLHVMELNNNPKQLSSRSAVLKDVLANKKVLVVDDDVRNIYSLTKAMEQYQIKVVTAVDGRDAVRQLEDNTDVNLILMDMMMPEMDGYETTRFIRSIHRYTTLPIIAVTAKAMTGDREKCIEAGASDYISKPVDTDQLISLLRVWLYNQN